MKPRTLLRGGSVLLPGGFRRADLLVEGRSIARVGPRLGARGCRVLDARGLRVLPGLIDTQLNGAFGISFGAAAPAEIAEVRRRLCAFGVTGFLATLFSLPKGRMLEAVRSIVRASEGGGARILGIHLEGPFLSRLRKGAHDPRRLRRPDLREFRELERAAGGLLRMMTLAPELPGAGPVIRAGARSGVVMSAGHSAAGAGRMAQAVGEGLRHVTHLYNAMAPFHHREGTILNAALTDDRLSCGLIYDRRHVSADAARLALRAKPEGSLVLVSDAVASLGLAEGPVRAGDRTFTLKDGAVTVPGTGRLAGAAVPLLQGVRWLAQDAGIPLERAWRLASEAPARLLGLRGKGALREGADADLALLSPGGTVRAVFVEGELEHGDPGRLGL